MLNATLYTRNIVVVKCQYSIYIYTHIIHIVNIILPIFFVASYVYLITSHIGTHGIVSTFFVKCILLINLQEKLHTYDCIIINLTLNFCIQTLLKA